MVGGDGKPPGAPSNSQARRMVGRNGRSLSLGLKTGDFQDLFAVLSTQLPKSKKNTKHHFSQ
jgi:hypothetical protein